MHVIEGALHVGALINAKFGHPHYQDVGSFGSVGSAAFRERHWQMRFC
jgi:hypothetical protein